MRINSLKADKKAPTQLDRMFIELAKHRLLKNGDWVEKHAMTGLSLFGSFVEGEPIALFTAALCSVHEYALSYLQQCPCLTVMVFPENYEYVAERLSTITAFKDLVCHGPKLKELCEQYGLSHLLRKVPGNQLHPNDYHVLKKLSKINPSTLSQIIPPRYQATWLAYLRSWSGLNDSIFTWAASEMGAIIPIDAGVIDNYREVCDFVREVPNTRLTTWARVSEAARDWHEHQVYEREHPEKEEDWDGDADYAPFPDRYDIPDSDLKIVALKNRRDLGRESLNMMHCVRSYWRRVRDKECMIFSLRQEGVPLATFEIMQDRTGAYRCTQIQGPRNSRVPQDPISMIHHFTAKDWTKCL